MDEKVNLRKISKALRQLVCIQVLNGEKPAVSDVPTQGVVDIPDALWHDPLT